jgi:hypothetical protein
MARRSDRFGLSRPRRIRPTLPIVVVVCDDARTAVAYFTELKREVKEKVTLQVVPAPCDGATPDDVVSLAIKWGTELSSEAHHDPEDAKELVWALIDLEVEAQRQAQAHQAKKKAQQAGVSVALSMPCFEVWTLAHLIDTGEHFMDCDAVLARIRKEWKKRFNADFGRQKAQADYSKLMEHRDEAVRRARMRSAGTDQSWTEVYQVVEAVLGQAQ